MESYPQHRNKICLVSRKKTKGASVSSKRVMEKTQAESRIPVWGHQHLRRLGTLSWANSSWHTAHAAQCSDGGEDTRTARNSVPTDSDLLAWGYPHLSFMKHRRRGTHLCLTLLEQIQNRGQGTGPRAPSQYRAPWQHAGRDRYLRCRA